MGKGFYSKLEIENNLVGNSKKSFNDEMVENLKTEAKDIMNKLPNIREQHLGSYKNLINILRDLARLIDDYGWKFMYSEHKTMYGDEIPQLSIWEQNSDGQIRNHKVFNLKDTQNSIEYEDLYEFIEEDAKSIEEYVSSIILEFEDLKNKSKSDEERKFYEIKIESYIECMNNISPLLRMRIEDGY